MISIEGWAESAPTLDSIESYVQTWIEDCTYVDESSDDGGCDVDVNEFEKEQKGVRKKVRFAELIAVRPIPAAGRARPRPSGARAWLAQNDIWRGMRTSGTSIDKSPMSRPKSRQHASAEAS